MRLKKYKMRMLPLVVLTWLLVGCQSNLVKPQTSVHSFPQTIVDYTITNSELLEACTAEYRSMAEKADGHAIDVERLSEVWPEKELLK